MCRGETKHLTDPSTAIWDFDLDSIMWREPTANSDSLFVYPLNTWRWWQCGWWWGCPLSFVGLINHVVCNHQKQMFSVWPPSLSAVVEKPFVFDSVTSGSRPGIQSFINMKISGSTFPSWHLPSKQKANIFINSNVDSVFLIIVFS